jgi:hypothetical protein
MPTRRKKLTKDQAARKLYEICKQAIAHLPAEEQERRWKRFGERVDQLLDAQATSTRRRPAPTARGKETSRPIERKRFRSQFGDLLILGWDGSAGSFTKAFLRPLRRL